MGNTVTGGTILARGFSSAILTYFQYQGKLSVFQKSAWLIRDWHPGATHGRIRPVHGFDTDILSCARAHADSAWFATLAIRSPLETASSRLRVANWPGSVLRPGGLAENRQKGRCPMR